VIALTAVLVFVTTFADPRGVHMVAIEVDVEDHAGAADCLKYDVALLVDDREWAWNVRPCRP
jgi:hypothetical protein